MHVLVAPCSFKESLTATAAAHALARVARERGHTVDEAPLADGGEGTLDALAPPLDLAIAQYDVRGMLGARVNARFGVARDLSCAVVECAEVVGLHTVPRAERDPLRATTHGLGELLVHVAGALPGRVLVALGGSGTVDGGAGMRAALAGRALPPLVGLVDVDVPLAGARMFMAQKLAAPPDDATLDLLTARLLALYPPELAAHAGAGAAGGLGAAILALGGTLTSGADFVMDALGIDALVARADLVLTGEGRIDEQTARGKAVARLAATCRRHGKRLVAFTGAVRGDRAPLAAAGVTDVVVITPAGQPLDDALAHAGANLAAAARAVL